MKNEFHLKFLCFSILLGLSAIFFHGCAESSSKPNDSNAIFPLNYEKETFYRSQTDQKFSLKFQTGKYTWGIIVPHHLLAADLTAQSLKQLSKTGYKKIFILSPDHFQKTNKPIILPDKNLYTPFGYLSTDQEEITYLSSYTDSEISNTAFESEHGISAITPFIKLFWPDAKIVPVIIRNDASLSSINTLALHLLKLIAQDQKTLIILSSDFSHYLSPEDAKLKDAETIQALKKTDLNGILALKKVENCDAVNILYLLKKIQLSSNSGINLFINKNSQDYLSEKITSSTSYLIYYFYK